MGTTFIIAEIGTAHGGDIGLARELIHAARDAGADCAKFQYVIADEIIHPRTGAVRLPGGDIPLYDRFRALEQPEAFYGALMAECSSAGIAFLCAAYGIGSARSLRALGVDRLKVASPELNHLPLLEEVRSYPVSFIASTGVSRLADMERAADILGRERTTILHCITAYPAPEEQYNLRLIPNLAAVLGVPVGVSDHSQDPELVPTLAVALGAVAVEKHFTLSREGGGLDDPIAMDPVMFTRMAAAIRRAEALLARDPAQGVRSIIREFEAEHGRSRIEAILGDGVKRPAAAEAPFYETTRRSLLAVTDLAAGTVLERSHLAPLRSETLPPGLDPGLWDRLTGARLVRPLASGEGIRWEHLLGG